MSMETIETIILRNLIQNDEYTRRALPFVDEEYFKDRNERVVFGIIRDHIHKYNKAPNKDAKVMSATSATRGKTIATINISK